MPFNSISSAVREILLNDSALSTEIGSRIYGDVLPQNPVMPAITIQQTTSEFADNIQGFSGLEKAVFQIDVWSLSASSRNTISELLRLAICGYTGNPLGVKIQGIRLESRFDRYEVEVKNYRKVHRVIVWHREENPSNA